MLELKHPHAYVMASRWTGGTGSRTTCRIVVVVGACMLLLSAFLFALADSISPASAAPDPVTVFLRVEGPADRATFGQTGEYVTVWSGNVEVPREVTITATSGRQYRLFVEDGSYKSTRLDTNETRVLGPADDSLGATSVLAALHAASQLGSFNYQVTDNFYPGQGFFVTSIGGVTGSGAVGWSYRVWNDEVAASPQVSVEQFLLGYDSTSVTLPHRQALFYWGYATRCLPLRVTPLEDIVHCGFPTQVLVEAYVDDASSGGYWRPVEGACVPVLGECWTSDAGGISELACAETGALSLGAYAGYDGSFYYVPADGLATVEVTGPCEVISFTLVDHGNQGINFGYVVPGTVDAPERDQSADHGAVTLEFGTETSVDCVVQLRASGGLAGDGADVPLSGVTWAVEDSAVDSTPITVEYVTIGQAPAGTETRIDVWHWLTVPVDQPYGVYAGQFYFRATGESP